MSGSPLVSGYDMVNGKKALQPHNRTIICRSGGAITVGWPVRVQTSTPYGLIVTTCNTANDHALLGLYQGNGGSLTVVTNVTNLNGGRAATTDDQVEIVVEGPVYVRARMSATNAGTLSTTNAISALSPSAIEGTFEIASAPAASIVAKVVLVGTGTLTNTTDVESSGIAAYVNP